MFQYVNDCPCGVYTHGKDKGKKKRQGDCVIRAFQMAWGLLGEDGWKVAATKLFTRSLEVGDVQNGEDTWRSFVKKSDKPRYVVNEKGNYKIFKDGTRHYYTIKEFAKYTKDDGQGYIVLSAHHLTFVKGGKYYDSWDSGNRPVRSSFILKSE